MSSVTPTDPNSIEPNNNSIQSQDSAFTVNVTPSQFVDSLSTSSDAVNIFDSNESMPLLKYASGVGQSLKEIINLIRQGRITDIRAMMEKFIAGQEDAALKRGSTEAVADLQGAQEDLYDQLGIITDPDAPNAIPQNDDVTDYFHPDQSQPIDIELTNPGVQLIPANFVNMQETTIDFNGDVPDDINAVNNMQNAINAYISQVIAYNNAATTFNNAGNAWGVANNTFNAAQNAYNNALNTYNQAVNNFANGTISAAAYNAALATFQNARNTYQTALNTYQNAQNTYNNAATAFQNAVSGLDMSGAAGNLNAAINDYNNYVNARNAEIDAYNAAINAYNAQANAQNALVNSFNATRDELGADSLPLQPLNSNYYSRLPTINSTGSPNINISTDISAINNSLLTLQNNLSVQNAGLSDLFSQFATYTSAFNTLNGSTIDAGTAATYQSAAGIFQGQIATFTNTRNNLRSSIDAFEAITANIIPSATIPVPSAVPLLPPFAYPVTNDAYISQIDSILNTFAFQSLIDERAFEYNQYLLNLLGFNIRKRRFTSSAAVGLGSSAGSAVGSSTAPASPFQSSSVFNKMLQQITNMAGTRLGSTLISEFSLSTNNLLNVNGFSAAIPGNKAFNSLLKGNLNALDASEKAAEIGFFEENISLLQDNKIGNKALERVDTYLDQKGLTFDGELKNALASLLTSVENLKVTGASLLAVSKALGVPGLIPQALGLAGVSVVETQLEVSPETAQTLVNNALAQAGPSPSPEAIQKALTDQFTNTGVPPSTAQNVASQASPYLSPASSSNSTQNQVALENYLQGAIAAVNTLGYDRQESNRIARALEENVSLQALESTVANVEYHLKISGLDREEVKQVLTSAQAAYNSFNPAINPDLNPLKSANLFKVATPAELAEYFQDALPGGVPSGAFQKQSSMLFLNPNSALNIVRENISTLREIGDQDFASFHINQFKDFTKLYTDTSEFLGTLISPAQILILGSSNEGLMYSEQNTKAKKSIDIQV